MSTEQSACAICLGSALARGGGVPLTSPGCCGKWFHQSCLLQLPTEGTSQRNSLMNIFSFSNRGTRNGNTVSRRCPNCRSLFSMQDSIGTITTNADFMEEDEVVLATENNTNVQAEFVSQALVLESSTEYPVIGLSRNTLYARVSLTYPENFASNFTTQDSALDIVCILDNSGSM